MCVKARRDFVDRLVRRAGCLGWICVLTLITPSCATPVGVDYVDRSVAYHSLTANVLYADKPSSFSARELMNLNLYQRFEEDPRQGLAGVHTTLWSRGGEGGV